jgi:hypothetical protein
MMQIIAQNLVFIAAIGVPVLIIFLLRTDAAVAFLSLCAGSLLVRYVGNEATLVGSAVSNNATISNQYAQLALLLLPVILSTLLLRGTMKGSKTIFNIIPALAVGLVGMLLTVPLLPYGGQNAVMNTEGWRLLSNNQEIVITASCLLSLAVLWFSHFKSRNKKHHKH